MAKEEPKIPVEGSMKLEFIRCTSRLANVLEDVCADSLYRVQLYSREDGEILMLAIVSDDEGSLFHVVFQMNPEELVLRVSNTFKTVSSRSKALVRIKDEIIYFITAINKLGRPISAVFFDIGQKFASVTYDHDPKEKGSFRVYLQAYSRDYCGIADMKGVVGTLASF